MNVNRLFIISLSLVLTQKSWTMSSHALEIIVEDDPNQAMFEQDYLYEHKNLYDDENDNNIDDASLDTQSNELTEDEKEEEEMDDVKKAPIIENGLLVLNHENLLDTMMGKNLKYNEDTHVNVDMNQSSDTATKTKNNTHNNSTNGTLLLIAFHEPWCVASKHMIRRLEQATQVIQEKFKSFDVAIENNISPPIVGKMDTSGFNNDDLIDFFALFDSSDNESALPALKFVFIEQYDSNRQQYYYNGTIKENGEEERNNGVERTIIDFVGETQSVDDILETVMHYWYRFVLSGHISYETVQQFMAAESNDDELEDGNIPTQDLPLVSTPIRPIFTFPNLDSISSFVTNHNDLFNPVVQDFTSVSDREEMYIRSILALDEITEPFLGFVQCREINFPIQEDVSDLYQQFDDLAQTYIYRRDVAFFVVLSHNCNWIGSTEDDLDVGTGTTRNEWDGNVRTLKIDSSSPPKLNEPTWTLGNLYPQADHDATTLSMTDFVIVQSTPSVLWLDKPSSSSLAFPIYRKIHFVLFIDMHTPRLKDGSFKYSSSTYDQSKDAISQLRKTATSHHQRRPSEDVVFLIVPSTEIQILTTFGIDIWSSMDDACSKSNTKQCYVDGIPQLPMGMITSRRNSDSLMLRYYLHSDSINENDDALHTFLSDFFDGKLVHQVKSEKTPKENKLSSGVQVLTGDTFDDLVMLKYDKHSLVQFYAPYCGHCKRFNIIWNELAETIHKFHWDSIIDVMIIDVTKNDVILDIIDLHSLPSVFLFPKGKKESPIEMKIQGEEEAKESSVGEISDVYPILEWMIDCNVLDDEELYQKIRYDA